MVTSDTHAHLQLWKTFDREFPTEQHCLEELYRRSSEEGVVYCRHCNREILDRKFGGRVACCSNCNRSTWLTAGTFFHHLRVARPWLGAIWLLERGAVISSSQFQKLSGVSYSTAWSIFQKLAAVIHTEMADTALAAHSSLFLPAICRRSRETPANLHPIAEQGKVEQAAFEESQSNTLRPIPCNSLEAETVSPSGTLNFSPEQMKVYALIEADTVHFDELCQRSDLPAGRLSSVLTLLELDGHVTRQVGDRYSRRIPALTMHSPGNEAVEGRLAPLIDRFLKFIKWRFRGIGRKYLQHYLALHWCHTNRVRWGSGMLLVACARARPARNSDTLKYVTPVLAMVCPDP